MLHICSDNVVSPCTNWNKAPTDDCLDCVSDQYVNVTSEQPPGWKMSIDAAAQYSPSASCYQAAVCLRWPTVFCLCFLTHMFLYSSGWRKRLFIHGKVPLIINPWPLTALCCSGHCCPEGKGVDFSWLNTLKLHHVSACSFSAQPIFAKKVWWLLGLAARGKDKLLKWMQYLMLPL